MPKVSPIQNSFNAGELSPRLAGRTDFDKYRAGCSQAAKLHAARAGPGRAPPRHAPGGHAVKQVLDRTWLVPFSFNTEQSYVIEMGDSYARFYTNARSSSRHPSRPTRSPRPTLVADLTNTDGTLPPVVRAVE
jgi:hypothetical protein